MLIVARKTSNRFALRRFAAVLICLLFLADWASHAVMPNEIASSGAAFIATEAQHDHDHGGFFCRGEDHREQTTTGGNSDAFAHSGILAAMRLDYSPIVASDATAFFYLSEDAIFRSVSPPFVPPEIS